MQVKLPVLAKRLLYDRSVIKALEINVYWITVKIIGLNLNVYVWFTIY